VVAAAVLSVEVTPVLKLNRAVPGFMGILLYARVSSTSISLLYIMREADGNELKRKLFALLGIEPDSTFNPLVDDDG
jgi:hypothetical protein